MPTELEKAAAACRASNLRWEAARSKMEAARTALQLATKEYDAAGYAVSDARNALLAAAEKAK